MLFEGSTYPYSVKMLRMTNGGNRDRTEEFDGLIDEDGGHGEDDEEDEGDAQDLQRHLADVQVPLHAVNVRDFAENAKPVAKLLAPENR
jgi:hypothetical protein